MKIKVHYLKLLCRLSEEVVSFGDDITFIHGTLSLGKSTVARLIDFCFGADLEMTTAIQRELLGVQLTISVGKHEVLIERNKGEGHLRVSWVDEDGAISLQVKAKGDGPVVYGTDVQNISDLIFVLMGYPILKVKKRTDDDESPLIRLGFRDIWKFSYLEQEHLDSSFFRLGSPVLAEKSKDSLNFFMGYFSETLSALQAEIEQQRSDMRAKITAAEQIREFLAKFDFTSRKQIEDELEDIENRARELREELKTVVEGYLGQTHFVDDKRATLREMSDGIDNERANLQDLERVIEEQTELRAELMSLKFRAARANHARSVLGGVVFEHCPQCGQSIDRHRASPDSCYVCLQVISPSDTEISTATIYSDLDARLADIEAALRRHSTAAKQQRNRIDGLTAERMKLDREVSDLLFSHDLDRVARTRSSEREIAQLEEKARFLERVKAMPDAVTAMLEEADALSIQIAATARKIQDEQTRLSYTDANFSALEENFLAALVAIHVPGITPKDKIVINRRTLIPHIWPGGDESASYSFFNAGSGGKKTLLTICFALALHRTAAARHLPVPTILIIDTPTKNITPDINPEIVYSFYEYLYEIAEKELAGHQIVIIDQLLVSPQEDSDLQFKDILMTEDDPQHPPLISYYHGP
ncbi:MAG: AAA family ATPase [Allorhizobium sp.]